MHRGLRCCRHSCRDQRQGPQYPYPFLLLNHRRPYDAGRRGGPFHKDPSSSASRIARTLAAIARAGAYQGVIDPRRLIFIDETWTKNDRTRLRGWAPRGERLVEKVPQGKWKTAT